MYNRKVMSDKPCTFSYKSKACKFVHPADSSPQFLHVFKDASFFSRYSRFGVPINFGFCLFRAIENNRQRTIFFFLCWTWIFWNGKETTPNKKELNIKNNTGCKRKSRVEGERAKQNDRPLQRINTGVWPLIFVWGMAQFNVGVEILLIEFLTINLFTSSIIKAFNGCLR